MVETMVVCARAIGGSAIEMVAVVPPIMKARRVVLILAFPFGRLLMVTSADARCGWLVKSVRKTVDNVASSVPSLKRRSKASRRARVQRGEGDVDCGARPGPGFCQPD